MDIDWSQAPEGTTHKVIGGCWYKVYGDCVSFFNGYGEWHAPSPLKDYAAEWEDFIPRPASAVVSPETHVQEKRDLQTDEWLDAISKEYGAPVAEQCRSILAAAGYGKQVAP